MKRFASILICVAIIFSSVVAFADLSETEQLFAGSWVLYMKSGKTTYLYALTFFDDLHVVMKTLSFNGSDIVSDHVASGKWVEFTKDNILLSLAGNQFVAGIKDNGLLVLLDYNDKQPYGFFSPVPDLSYLMFDGE